MSGRERLSNRRIIKNIEDKGLPGIKVLEEEADKSLQRGRQALPHRLFHSMRLEVLSPKCSCPQEWDTWYVKDCVDKENLC